MTYGLSVLFAFVLALVSPTSSAQSGVRQFPTTALRGLMEVTAPPNVLINGKAARLSPGARIKSPNNLIVLSATLVGQRVLVNYVQDNQGMLHEMWILNSQEAQVPRSGMENVSNIVFEQADSVKVLSNFRFPDPVGN